MSDKEVYQDRKAIIAALMQWMQSQEIPYASAGGLFVMAAGHLLHVHAKGDAGNLVEGLNRATKLLVAVAVEGV